MKKVKLSSVASKDATNTSKYVGLDGNLVYKFNNPITVYKYKVPPITNGTVVTTNYIFGVNNAEGIRYRITIDAESIIINIWLLTTQFFSEVVSSKSNSIYIITSFTDVNNKICISVNAKPNAEILIEDMTIKQLGIEITEAS